jgi:hypothetical protein
VVVDMKEGYRDDYYSKLYCKYYNLLKITVKDREYSYKNVDRLKQYYLPSYHTIFLFLNTKRVLGKKNNTILYRNRKAGAFPSASHATRRLRFPRALDDAHI